jgi:uncharacterized membrane protein
MIRRTVSRNRLFPDKDFRWRSLESSRLEELSDAVIGFAITLLIVSLEVPRTFDELLIAVRGFAAFAISFGLLIVIWFEHYRFFRRYGLQDLRIIVLNACLLFLILFYVYPLKFLFTISVNSWLGISLTEASQATAAVPMMREDQLPLLLMLYAVGWTAVWFILGLFYQHALTQQDSLELNALEVFDTRASMSENYAAAGIGVLSISLTVLLPPQLLSLAGWSYLLNFPLTWGIRRWNDRRRQFIKISNEA